MDMSRNKKNLFSRCWYYFRNGWSTYFAFVFAAVNTLVTTYYLAINSYPTLKIIFPTFIDYVGIVSVIGIPILILVGYVHYKKTTAYKSEVDIIYESNPYVMRNLINSELILKLNLQLVEKMTKIMKNEKLTEDDVKELSKIENEILDFTKQRTFRNSKDLEFFKKMDR